MNRFTWLSSTPSYQRLIVVATDDTLDRFLEEPALMLLERLGPAASA